MSSFIEISDHVVFFVHIPKCAGTSLGDFFNTMLRPGGEFFWHGQDGDVNEIAYQDGFSSSGCARGLKFIGGHFTIDTARKIITTAMPLNPTICTVIRNPIEQAQSYFHWITSESLVKGAKHPLYDHCKHMTPLEFFNDATVLSEVSNIQSKYLLGVDCEFNTDYDIQHLALSLLLQKNMYIADLSQSDALVSTIAGLLHSTTTGDGQDIHAPRKNVSGMIKRGFDQTVIELIKEKFWGDVILYNTLVAAHENIVHRIFFDQQIPD